MATQEKVTEVSFLGTGVGAGCLVAALTPIALLISCVVCYALTALVQ